MLSQKRGGEVMREGVLVRFLLRELRFLLGEGLSVVAHVELKEPHLESDGWTCCFAIGVKATQTSKPGRVELKLNSRARFRRGWKSRFLSSSSSSQSPLPPRRLS
jgi:hypothetical protein